MTEEPQAMAPPVGDGGDQDAQSFNPVIEALLALQDLGRMIDEVQLTTSERIQARCAQAVGWSLLGSVSGGASIQLGARPTSDGDDSPNPLEQQAKAAFGD